MNPKDSDHPKEVVGAVGANTRATTSRYRTKSQDTLDRYDVELTSLYTLDNNAFASKEQTKDYEYDVYPGVESNEFDFAAERHNFYPINFFEAIAYLIKTCLGVGVLGIHEAYMHGGLWTSLVFNIIIGIMASHSILVLIESAQKMYVKLHVCKLSYSDLAELALATSPFKCSRKICKAFRYIVDFFILCQQCSACCVFEITIALILKEIAEEFTPGVRDMNGPLSTYILITSIPLLILTTIRRFKILAHLSICADFIIMVCVIATMYFGLEAAGDIKDRPGWKDFNGFFRFMGVCVYSVDGTTLALPIENNMSAPRLFPFVVYIGMSVVVISVVAVGFFGYWGFGESCRTPIFFHIPFNTVYIILQFLLILMFLINYAMNIYVPFHVVKRYTRRFLNKRHPCWDVVIRLIHVIVITCVCLVIPDILHFMSFIGNTFIVCMGLVFPAIIETLVCHKEVARLRWLFIKNTFILCLAVIMFLGGLCSHVYYAHNM